MDQRNLKMPRNTAPQPTASEPATTTPSKDKPNEDKHSFNWGWIVWPSVILLLSLCSGCLLRVEHNTTSPGAEGVVLDAQTHAPLSGARVVMSRLYGYEHITASDALTNTRPPVVITGQSGRFSIRPERKREVVLFMNERFREPDGTLVVRREGYEPALVRIMRGPIPLSEVAHHTNFYAVLLSPVAN